MRFSSNYRGRKYALPHPDRILFDPLPGAATKEAWKAVQFERDLAQLTEAVRRQKDFGQK